VNCHFAACDSKVRRPVTTRCCAAGESRAFRRRKRNWCLKKSPPGDFFQSTRLASYDGGAGLGLPFERIAEGARLGLAGRRNLKTVQLSGVGARKHNAR
jgi:hypothetical protein